MRLVVRTCLNSLGLGSQESPDGQSVCIDMQYMANAYADTVHVWIYYAHRLCCLITAVSPSAYSKLSQPKLLKERADPSLFTSAQIVLRFWGNQIYLRKLSKCSGT